MPSDQSLVLRSGIEHMRNHPSGLGDRLKQSLSGITDALRNVTGRKARASMGSGKTYAGGRKRGARQQQGPTPVLGAPGTPIRSSAAMNNSTAHGNPQNESGTKRKFGRHVGLVNKKRFAVTMSAVTAAVLVPIFATSALEGGMFASHGVSVQRPASFVEEEEDNNITLGAYASGTIVDQTPKRAPKEENVADAQAAAADTDGETVDVDNSEDVTEPSEPQEESVDEAGEAAADEPEGDDSTEPEATEDPRSALKPGVHDDAVIELQQRLMELEYMENDEPTDYYGPQTLQAVGHFQRKHGLTVDGNAGPETCAVLFSGDAKVYTVADGAEGGDVWEIQQRLNDLGYPVSVTGYYGSQTSDAVKYFQRMNGVTDDGSVGSATKDILFSEHAEPAIPPEPEPEPETQSEEQGAPAEEGSSESTSSSESSSSSSEESASESNSSSSSEESSSKSSSNDDEEEESSSGGGDAPAASSGSVEAFVDAACAQEGKPYVLGGKGPSTFDCSGLVYYALKASGNGIGYMTSGGWAQSGYPSISWDNLRRGDVICFHGHVAVYLGDGVMCDASSSNGQIMIRSMGSWARNNFICGKRPL